MKVPVRVVASVLLLVSICGQAQSFKLGYSSQAIHEQQQQQHQLQPQDHEQQLRQEQLEHQHHFEALQREQQQAEYQIQQQQIEAQHLLGRPLPAQRLEGGTKGATAAPAPIAYPSKSPSIAAEQRQQYLPPQSTIAYLVVRPPFQMPLSYEGAYLAPPPLQAPLIRPLENNYATKGARQPEELPTQQIEQQQQPQPQPALVVPVHGDKHGKLRTLLDRIMSRITLGSSYSVASEELVYPHQQAQTQAPGATKGEAPIVQHQIEQIPIVQQQQEQVHEEEPIVQQQQQQPQQVQEQERDPGFGDKLPAAQHGLKTARLEAPSKTSEPARQVEEEPQIQQQVQEQELIRQPPAPLKSQQQPLRQPEPVQQQRQEEPPTKSKRVIQLQPRQQQFSQQQEQVRFEPSKSYQAQ